MDPIFKLEMNQDKTKVDSQSSLDRPLSNTTGIEELESKRENKQTSDCKVNFFEILNYKQSLKIVNNYYTTLLFLEEQPVLLAGNTKGQIQVFRVWGYEEFFDRDSDQKEALLKALYPFNDKFS